MSRYMRYMIRQYFFNQLMPPLESHKIMGSHFLYDLVNCWMFYKIKDSATNKKHVQKKTSDEPAFANYYRQQHEKKHKRKKAL